MAMVLTNAMSSIIQLSPAQLRRAANLQEKIAALQKQLAQLVGADASPAPVVEPVKKKRGMSAAGRARIAAAQKARWAKTKGQSAKPAKPAKPAKAPGKRGKFSPQAKAALSAKMKAIWAARKAAKQ